MADRQFGELDRDPFGGRATPTDRASEANLETPADENMSGEPVGGNEEPAEMLEEDRKDPMAEEDAGPVPAAKKTAKK